MRCRILVGIQKGTIILTTTHMNLPVSWMRIFPRLKPEEPKVGFIGDRKGIYIYIGYIGFRV